MPSSCLETYIEEARLLRLTHTSEYKFAIETIFHRQTTKEMTESEEAVDSDELEETDVEIIEVL